MILYDATMSLFRKDMLSTDFFSTSKTWPFGSGQRRLALSETVLKGIQESEFRIMDSLLLSRKEDIIVGAKRHLRSSVFCILSSVF